MPGPTSDDDRPPAVPVRPSRDDCCGGGCYPCVFDLYADAAERYEAALAAWRERHPEKTGQEP